MALARQKNLNVAKLKNIAFSRRFMTFRDFLKIQFLIYFFFTDILTILRYCDNSWRYRKSDLGCMKVGSRLQTKLCNM